MAQQLPTNLKHHPVLRPLSSLITTSRNCRPNQGSQQLPSGKMHSTAAETSLRVLHLLPVLTSTATLMYAVDEHIFLGTWMHPGFRERANSHLPAWFYNWGRRGRWPIILGYPANYTLGLLNVVIAGRQIRTGSAAKWYALGLLFSVGHIAIYARKAIGLLADIKADVPKGNSTHSMGVWLKMNMLRTATTDFPAWLCFITAALKAL